MDARQRYALTSPLSKAGMAAGALAAYTATRRHATGLLILTILAVDR